MQSRVIADDLMRARRILKNEIMKYDSLFATDNDKLYLEAIGVLYVQFASLEPTAEEVDAIMMSVSTTARSVIRIFTNQRLQHLGLGSH